MFGGNTFGEIYFADGSEWFDSPITATGAVSSPHATLAATGTEKLSATGSVTAPVATLAATGNVANAAAQGAQGGGGPRNSYRQQFSRAPFDDAVPTELEWTPRLIGGRIWVDAPAATLGGSGTVGLAGVGSVKSRRARVKGAVATGPRVVSGTGAVKGGTVVLVDAHVRQSRQQELADDALLGISAA